MFFLLLFVVVLGLICVGAARSHEADAPNGAGTTPHADGGRINFHTHGTLFDDDTDSGATSIMDDDDFRTPIFDTDSAFANMVNPATGLPMIDDMGGVDVGGSPFGMDLHESFGTDSFTAGIDSFGSDSFDCGTGSFDSDSFGCGTDSFGSDSFGCGTDI